MHRFPGNGAAVVIAGVALLIALALVGAGVWGLWRLWRRFGGEAVLLGGAALFLLIGALLAAGALYAPNPLVDGCAGLTCKEGPNVG